MHRFVVRKGCTVESSNLGFVPSDVLLRGCGKYRAIDGVSDLLKKECKFTETHFFSKYDSNFSAEDALALLFKLKSGVVKLDTGVLCKGLKACAVLGSFDAGNLLLKFLIEIELELNIFVGSSLIDFYAKCGSIKDALKIFESMLNKNVVTWSAMISGLVQHDLHDDAFELFSEMLLEGFEPNEVTYMSILRGCASLATLDGGRHIYDLMKQSNYEENVFVASTIVDMYAKCGSLADAHSVFCKMPFRNVVSYSTLISGYVQGGRAGEALNIFEQMRDDKVKPDEVTFVSVLKAVAYISDLEEGRKVHALIRKQGCGANKYVGSALVDMYAKCKSVKDAQDAFNELAERDVVAWTSMIEAYAEGGSAYEALACFRYMEIEGILPISYTFVSILKACSSLADLSRGKILHALLVKIEEKDVFVASALINMYVNSGSIEEAEKAFRKLPRGNVALWNSMISGYLQHGLAAKAVYLFRRMDIECVQPNTVTLVAILKACSSFIHIKQVHTYILAIGLEFDLVLQNALTYMYAKCGRLEIALSLFNKLPFRNETSWNAIIAAYIQHEDIIGVLHFFMRMVEECILPNEHTFASIFKACSHWAILWQGHKFHLLMLQSDCCYDSPLYNSLVEMYAKCGSIKAARQVFDNMGDRSLISWNVMITNYAQHGMPNEALNLFSEMQEKDVQPSEVTFVGVLSACGHAGLIVKGEFYYVMLYESCSITPTIEHLVCLVAMLGRAGQIQKAEDLVQATIFFSSIKGAEILL